MKSSGKVRFGSQAGAYWIDWGIGPAATDYYYRRLIASFAGRNAPLEMTIAHADTRTLLSNLEKNDGASQVQIYNRLTERLARAGAECVVVSSIAGHFCIDLRPVPRYRSSTSSPRSTRP